MSKNKIYFGPEVEEAIRIYNSESNSLKKDKLYNSVIHPALDKLAENCINTWKFWKYETTYNDLKTDLIVFFFERIHMVDQSRGKAYSFFTFSARNFLIKYSMDLNKKTINKAELDEVDNVRDIMSEMAYSSFQETLKDFIIEWSAEVLSNLNSLFKSTIERRIAESFIRLLQLSPELETFNKKELYILIREHSKVDTQYITKILSKVKSIFYSSLEYYQSTGKVDVIKYL